MITPLARIDLNLLVSLRALLQQRSVTRAAEAVGLSQPAMSNALSRLRRLLDDELLIRDGNRLELTRRAQELEVPLARILDQIEREVLSTSPFDPPTSTRLFTIVASNSTTLTVVPEVLRILREEAPGVRLRILPQEMRNADVLLRRPDVDVVLLPDLGPTTSPRERLYNEPWVCVASKDNPHIGARLTLEQFAQLDHAYYMSEGMFTHPDLELQAHGAQREVRLQVEDFLLLPLMVEGTNMIAVVQERVARRMAKTAKVAIHPLPIAVSDLGIDMVWNARAEGDPGCAWLREVLVRAVASAS